MVGLGFEAGMVGLGSLGFKAGLLCDAEIRDSSL